MLTNGTVGESQNTIPASPRALIAPGLAEFDNEQSRDTIPGRSTIAVLQVQSLDGVKWKTSQMMKFQNGVCCLLPQIPTGLQHWLGPTVPDNVDALQYDLTHGDSDTERVATIRAGDVEHEDPAEEDEVRSVGCVEDVASEVEEEMTFQLPGVATRTAGFVSLEAVVMEEEFDERPCVMKSIPRFLRGPCKIAMRVALEEIESADDTWRELVETLSTLAKVAPPRSPRGGIKVLGKPHGHQDFVRAQLEMLSAHHHTLLARIPMVEDVQSAWLLLVHCASARANCVARAPRFVRDMTPGCGSVCAEFSTYLQSKGTTWSELLPCLLFWEALGCDLLVVGAPQRWRVGQTHCR